MKSTVRSILALCLLLAGAALNSFAATISGTIYTTNGVRGAAPVPLAGARVWIYNFPNAAGFISTTTSTTGAYSITIPSTWPASTPTSQTLINIGDSASTGGCRGAGKQIRYTGSNIIFDDTACNYPWYTIAGKVRLQGGGSTDSARVWLIEERNDTTGGTTKLLLKAVDSTFTDINGNYLFANAISIRGSVQRIKAALLPGHPQYANYLPTYHDSALIWSSATTFGATAWTSRVTNLNVMLVSGVNPGGPGFIGGNVLMGANKSTAVGDPLASRTILLRTAAGKGVAWTRSDAAGRFSFSNLPYGTYLLCGDAWSRTNPDLKVTISASSPKAAVIFEENSTKFAGRLGSLGVQGAALEAIHAYPSPMTRFVELNGLISVSGAKTAILRDIRGAVISRTAIDASAPVSRISTSDLSAGLYTLELQTASGNAVYKLVKE